MTKDEFLEWALGRGFTAEGAISGIGNWAKGRGNSVGKGDVRYILGIYTYIKERRPMGKFTRWQRLYSRKYSDVSTDASGKLVPVLK